MARDLVMLSLLATLCGCEAGFGAPTDVAFLSDGTPLVSDGYDNARVAVLGAEGSVAREWGEAGAEAGEFDLPHAVAVDSEDRVYVADRGNARVQVFTRAGEHLATWSGSWLGRPFGLAIRDDRVWMVDGGDQDPENPAGRVVVVSTSGEPIGELGGPGEEPA